MRKLVLQVSAAAVLVIGAAAIVPGAGDEGRLPDLDGAAARLNDTPLTPSAETRPDPISALLSSRNGP